MRAALVLTAAIALVLSSLSPAEQRRVDYCDLTIFRTTLSLGDGFYEKHGRDFEWSPEVTYEAMKRLKWDPNPFYFRLTKSTSFRLDGGRASYFLLALPKNACPADAHMPEEQGLLVGSYSHEGTRYRLYAHLGEDGAFDKNLSYAATGTYFRYGKRR